MKVHGHPLSSCTRKVLVTLAEKNRSAELVVVDLFAHAQKSAAHLARHPFGVVPVLEEDDGFVVYESRAILRHLDATLEGPSLTPRDARERARMDQWLSVDQSYVGPHTRALAIERLLRPREGLAVREDVCRASEEALAAAFGVYDRALAAGREWLAGDSFSLADISLMPYVASLPMIGAAHTIERAPNVRAWWSRVSARPSWKSVVRQ
jgi:glutathione S-transferase